MHTQGPVTVLVADRLSPETQELWRYQAPEGLTLTFMEYSDSARELLDQAHVIVTRRANVDEAMVASAPRLRIVQQLGRFPVGVDLEACRLRRVVVSVWPLLSRITVAEHAFALMLSVARSLGEGDRAARAGAYQAKGLTPIRTTEHVIAWNWMGLTVSELYGKVLGLVGAGEIALELAARARAFGMKVLYYNRRRLPPEWEDRLGLSFQGLDQLMAESDFVSLHLPHTPETEGMFDRARFERMKQGAFFINTARGGLVDEEALAAVLKSGHLRGAGLDVFAEEPVPVGHPLVLSNVFLSPHTGGGQAGGLPADLRRLFDHLLVAQAGESPQGRFELEAF